MADKVCHGNLKRLRAYMAEEAKRLGRCGGRVHQIDLDALAEEKACSIPAEPCDPLEKDLDELFGSSNRRKPS